MDFTPTAKPVKASGENGIGRKTLPGVKTAKDKTRSGARQIANTGGNINANGMNETLRRGVNISGSAAKRHDTRITSAFIMDCITTQR